MAHFGADGSLTEAEFEQVVRTASKVVAAYNAPASILGLADYVCDGTSDQVQIQAAIDACSSGGEVVLSPGTFNLTASGVGGGNASTIFLDDDVWLRGAGWNLTKLILGNSVDENVIGMLSKSNVHISDLYIDGNKDNNTETGADADGMQNGIYMNGCNWCTIERVLVKECIFHGIFNYSNGSNNYFLYNRLISNRYRAIHAHSTVNYNQYIGNYATLNGDGGTGGIFVVYNGANHNIIANNIIFDEISSLSTGVGLIELAGDGASYGNKVIGNTLVADTYSDSHGIRLFSSNELYDTLIANNTIKGVSQGIIVNTETPTNLQIVNNIIRPVGIHAIDVHDSAAAERMLIDGNNCYCNAGEAIYLNHVRNSKISNNVTDCVGNHDALALLHCVNNLIEGHQFYNSKYEIDIDADCTGNKIRNNNSSGASDGMRNLGGLTNIFDGNTGYLGPGEERIAQGVLTAGAQNAFAFAWQNPHDQKIIVTKVVIDVTTAGGTATAVLAVGTGATATTASDNLMDDDGGNDLDAAAVYNSIDHAGTNGIQGQKVDENGGTTDYVTGQILTEAAGSLVGKYYIYYTGV